MRLDGKVTLVTGGGKRVGRAIVLELAEAGCDVAIHYHRSEEDAQETATLVTRMGCRAITVHGNLEDPASWPTVVRQAVDGLGRLDILVNNASVFLSSAPDTIDAFDSKRWESVLRTNLVAPMGLSHHARSHLAADGMGKIVNVSDISAERPWPDHLAYCISKAGLDALTKGLARALAPSIQVNGVALGIAVFPEEYSQTLRRSLVGKVPLQRAGTPGEVAAAVRFIVEAGDYMTGEIIKLDGGRSIT
ncbi:MAG: SDR family oxidoreductase [Phycisphaerae bacterium]